MNARRESHPFVGGTSQMSPHAGLKLMVRGAAQVQRVHVLQPGENARSRDVGLDRRRRFAVNGEEPIRGFEDFLWFHPLRTPHFRIPLRIFHPPRS